MSNPVRVLNIYFEEIGRGERIRTSDLLVPNQAL